MIVNAIEFRLFSEDIHSKFLATLVFQTAKPQK